MQYLDFNAFSVYPLRKKASNKITFCGGVSFLSLPNGCFSHFFKKCFKNFKKICGCYSENLEFLERDEGVFYPKVKKESKNTLIERSENEPRQKSRFDAFSNKENKANLFRS